MTLLSLILTCIASVLLARAEVLAQNATAPSLPRFILVAPRPFIGSLADFVTYKSENYTVTLLELESILTDASSSSRATTDDPEKLKRRLYDEWKRDPALSVLLVGDADVLPVRYMVLDRHTDPAFHYAFYPSDLYYADLAKDDGAFDDWNAVKDSFHAAYFGEVRGEHNKSDPMNYDQVSYTPEIPLGRWPVSTPEQVRAVAAKSIAYETRVRAESTKPRAAAGVRTGRGEVEGVESRVEGRTAATRGEEHPLQGFCVLSLQPRDHPLRDAKPSCTRSNRDTSA